MAHIHFAWELGGGLGHAARMKALARVLQQRGHRISLSLRDLVQTDPVLADLDAPRLPAPVFLHRIGGLPTPPLSMAEILISCGYLDFKSLHGLATGWRCQLQALQPDLVVTDYAPTAVLAAHSLGLPVATIGNAFYIPPPGPLPTFAASAPPARLHTAEARVLAAANAVLAGWGAAPLEQASTLLRGDHAFLCTWSEMDHYARDEHAGGERWWGPETQGGGGQAPAWPAADGPRVFAYLKSGFPAHVDVLRTLAARGCATVCYLPEVAAGKAPPVSSPHIAYASAPVDLRAALPQSALCVCHGGDATVGQALLAGVPMLLLPMHQEQNLIANRVQACGAARNAGPQPTPAQLKSQLDALLDDAAFTAAARAIAARRAGFDPVARLDGIAQAIEQLLPAG